MARESSAWNAFRNGIWVPPSPATLHPGVLFPADPASIDQFSRQQAPDTGEEPRTPEHRMFMGATMAALLERTGPAVLFTHSNSGQYGWYTAMAAPALVRAIVAYEPGAYVFSEGERPGAVPSAVALVDEHMQPCMVPMEQFLELTKMPIVVIYGDNIADVPGEVFNVEIWRVASARGRQFVDAVNRHGGNARYVSLPEAGIRGNTHAPLPT